ncbi:hypothetical protein KCG48_11715 [Proteiniclasticum sp. BAD-10]|uniref:Uncharacterized protein n=1 Tax=Proteiniclasticum sediminis TaxID=2804028 RepID=A0A941CSL3_9CLOT|nr:hypothetical protein [Proteiniclasticum sediminis]MBR0576983.1 hypothetical protein [Proteiniclasticum sediminis]
MRIQNIGSGHALNVKLWWKIQDFGGTFKENAIVQDKINFGIIGKDEIRQLRVFENKRMFQSIDEYCRFQTDKIYQLAYLISYEDIFDNSYIYLAYYKIHDGKIEEIKSFPISRKASEAEINVYGLNKLEH